MEISGLLKVSLAVAGATGVAGGGVFLHKLINKDTISKHIDSNILLTSTQQDKWTHRLSLINKAVDTDLSKELLAIKKSKNPLTVDDLKSWCKDSLESEFVGTKDKKFMNIRLYCGLNVGDKIQGTKVSSSTGGENEKLKTNFGKLKNKTNSKLVSSLFSIKDTENTGSPWKGSTSLRDWCLSAFDMPFETGLTYDNAKDYCVITA
ncbi:hypothetical protein MHC_03785 [Mycoplasma haemocanis str. Illinois]|uniref:Uncharacterized protein n=1 Tax=Mycoplasma haemocanis (strain Illinois) TaxID=1111676 RepID=H6N7J5_MYCHN|nr:hypothetical protein [Mycoplasma haemocanis]AEW45617.1 hypothetical protein MHC_03785 [Mycoplasma haemocanis str. Illinois]